MKKLLFCLTLFFWQCGNSNPQTGKPEKLMARQEFKEALELWHFAVAAVELRMIKGEIVNDYSELQAHVLLDMGVDTAQFRHTLLWYAARPEKLIDIYQEILDEYPVKEPDI
jgi:hypothetical protein